MFVCKYVCTYVHTYVCMFACTCVRMGVCMYVWLYVQGWLVAIPFFYGGFNEEQIHVDAFGGAVQFSYNVPLAYICTIIGCLAISLFSIIHRWVQCDTSLVSAVSSCMRTVSLC